MRYAIVSDIHANRPAWQAVLDDIAREGVDAICCLGDIVGYGPRPHAVLDSVLEHCENIVLGNHDAVIAGKLSPNTFNPAARAVIEWTRERLGEEWREPFASLPLTLRGDGMLLTHGDVEQPGKFRYVVRPEQARASFRASKCHVLFFGHTHQPGVFSCRKTEKTIDKLPPRDLVLAPGKRYMINPGSVGDPRCRSDLRASYCLYNSESRQLRFRRVEFDVEEYRRDFAASGLTNKPLFLRVLDAESSREGDAGPVVADHVESARVDAGPDRSKLARLHVAGVPLQPTWQQSQVLAAQQEALRRHRKSNRTAVVLSLFVIVAVGIALGFLLPLGSEGDAVAEEAGAAEGEPTLARPAHGVTLISTGGDPTKSNVAAGGSDLERIMAEGWEDPVTEPSGSSNKSR